MCGLILLFRVVLDLQKNYEVNRELPYTPYPASSIMNILHWNGTFIKISEPVLICYY